MHKLGDRTNPGTTPRRLWTQAALLEECLADLAETKFDALLRHIPTMEGAAGSSPQLKMFPVNAAALRAFALRGVGRTSEAVEQAKLARQLFDERNPRAERGEFCDSWWEWALTRRLVEIANRTK